MQDYYEIEWALGERFRGNVIADDELYSKIRELTRMAYLTMRMGDKRWFYFYVPVKRDRKLIALPFGVVLYRGRFFVSFEHTGQLEVRKEADREEIYGRKIEEASEKKLFGKLLKNALSFVPKIKKNPKILEKLVPYDLREGKVKRKYIDEGLMPLSEAERVKRKYVAHKRKKKRVFGCSLNEYLEVAAICYRAAYESGRTRGKTPRELYHAFADGRHGGMLDIEDGDSREEFAKWCGSGRWAGSHPFEIVFSWHEHGIHLYPPGEYNGRRYGLQVTNYVYAEAFIRMVDALIHHKVPFVAHDLGDVLDYLTGEYYLRINSYGRGTLPVFISSKGERGFRHVEWQPLRVVKFRK